MNDFMKDRYGADNLTTVLGSAGMAVTLIGMVADWDAVKWLGLAVVIVSLLRALSKNIEARQRENEAWLQLTSRLPWKKGGASGGKPRPSKEDLKRQAKTARQMWKDRKTKAFLKCPTCGTTLAVPKGKGRMIVTCPKCRTKMETKA